MRIDANDHSAFVLPLPYEADSCIYFERIRALDYPILLDSNAQHSFGNFDIITAAPVATIQTLSEALCPTSQTHSYRVTEADSSTSIAHSELKAYLRKLTNTYTSNNTIDSQLIPFISGLFTVASYDYGKSLHIESKAHNYRWPDFFAGLYQWAININHKNQTAYLVADRKIDQALWQQLNALLTANKQHKPLTTSRTPFKCLQDWQSNTTLQDYQNKFKHVNNYILNGDCYQINLAQRFETRFTGDPWQAYKCIKTTSPTPYSAYIELPQGALCSFSPERFIKVQNNLITTQPIKGTRPRGVDKTEDLKLIDDLKHSLKERSENLMIVDLMRNDLSRCAKTGSVRTPALFSIETHPNVHHLVSTVEAELQHDKDCFDLLLNTLPGGSITGAPKKRAIEIIEQLENDARGVYCGTLAYIDRRGNMDSNILIRTVLFEHDKKLERDENQPSETGTAYCWGGGGIVVDSISDNEHHETLIKVENLMHSISQI